MTSSATQMLDVSLMEVEDGAHALIERAAQIGASDLFFLSNDKFMAINVRHLGIVRPLSTVDLNQGRRFLQHIKAQAAMDVGERRRPLDGRWIYEDESGSIVDLRINSIPTLHGEDFTIRLLAHETGLMDVADLGLTDAQRRQFKHMMDSPGGLILCTGPTGSGKTTTLYASLTALNNGTRKINTIEDPIEYEIAGLRQSQINPVLHLGFVELLRSVLRQSPDVIMIGEIRDVETAQTAVRAANGGHLVFSTLHAPVAAAAIQSMRALDVHPHFLATCLRGIVTQRLVRTLCPHCRVEFDISNNPQVFDEIENLLSPDEGKAFYAPKGCERCDMLGYTSRTGLFEVMDITKDVRNQIIAGAPIADIRAKAIEKGMLEFRKAALLKVARGQTSIEEVFRVVPSEHLRLHG